MIFPNSDHDEICGASKAVCEIIQLAERTWNIERLFEIIRQA